MKVKTSVKELGKWIPGRARNDRGDKGAKKPSLRVYPGVQCGFWIKPGMTGIVHGVRGILRAHPRGVLVGALTLVMAFSGIFMFLPGRSLAGEYWVNYTNLNASTTSYPSGLTLNTGTNYRVTATTTIGNDRTVAQDANGNGITINGTGAVTLYIPAGVTVNATGRAGSGQTGGGAGVALPSGANLYVRGGGTLNATGGKAGDGAAGTKAGDGWVKVVRWSDDSQPFQNSNLSEFYTGDGGAGGAGGGGAGAGIGSRGGNGGAGGAGVTRAQDKYEFESHLGGANPPTEQAPNPTPGNSGKDGVASTAVGNLYALDTVTVNGYGGARGATGAKGAYGTTVIDPNTSTIPGAKITVGMNGEPVAYWNVGYQEYWGYFYHRLGYSGAGGGGGAGG
jgi:hypothetical protein